jgi:hypothetical protein
MMKSHVAGQTDRQILHGGADIGGSKVSARVDTASSQAITGKDLLHAVDGKKLTVTSRGGVVPIAGATSAVRNPRWRGAGSFLIDLRLLSGPPLLLRLSRQRRPATTQSVSLGIRPDRPGHSESARIVRNKLTHIRAVL